MSDTCHLIDLPGIGRILYTGELADHPAIELLIQGATDTRSEIIEIDRLDPEPVAPHALGVMHWEEGFAESRWVVHLLPVNALMAAIGATTPSVVGKLWAVARIECDPKNSEPIAHPWLTREHGAA